MMQIIIILVYKSIIIGDSKWMELSPYLIIFVAIMICYLYVIMSEFFTHRKCNYIHQTAVAILLGVVLGVFLTFLTNTFDNNQYGGVLKNIIILLLLPPMLFEDGYNIRKRKFFQNIMYINLYGVLGTIINFLALFGILFVFNNYNLVRSINNQPIQLRTWQLLAMASCLCSIDTVVPEKIVNPQRYPKLFSIIFGESIMKDTITVTLFDSIIHVYQKLEASGATQFDPASIGFLVLKFAQVIVCSILIGITSALVTTVLFKNFRFLMAQKGVAEVALILLTGFASYILSEWAAFSGVISMLFCGITLSHFNVYNLTPQGKSAAKISVSTLALLAQGLLFFLLGAFIFSIQFNKQEDKTVQYTFSYSLLLVTILALIIARFINIYFISMIGYLTVGKNKWRLNQYQYQIMAISGLVKGAIPFALILNMPVNKHTLSTQCVQNTVITIVFFTSLMLNSLMPKFIRNRLKKIDDMIRFNTNHPSLYDSLLIEYQKIQAQHHDNKTSNLNSNKSQISSRFESKKQLQQMAILARLKSTTQKYWRRCEEGFLKPHLIFDYHNRRQQIKMDKIKARKQEAEEFWRNFRGQNYLDPENQENNKFIDIKLIESDVYSQQQQIGKVLQDDGNFVFYKQKSKQEPKNDLQLQLKPKSKTQGLSVTVRSLDKNTEIPQSDNKQNLQKKNNGQQKQKDHSLDPIQESHHQDLDTSSNKNCQSQQIEVEKVQ